jgi:hypothetical protein
MLVLCCSASQSLGEDVTEAKSDEYTEEMQARMGTTLTYRHEDGINYNFVLPDLIVGSCLQGPEDVDRLQAAGVTTVFSLQVRRDKTLSSHCFALLTSTASHTWWVLHLPHLQSRCWWFTCWCSSCNR